MHKILFLITICFFTLSCSDSDEERVYDPGKSVISRPYIIAPLGKLAFKLEDKNIYLDDAGDHILRDGITIDVTSVSAIKLRIIGSNDPSSFQINTQSRSGESPVQESLTLSVIASETGVALFSKQNAFKAGDDLFIFRNIMDAEIPMTDVDRIFIRVINDIDGGIWCQYIQPAWTVSVEPIEEKQN